MTGRDAPRERVALVTAAAAVGLDEDEPLLVDALAARGVQAVPVVWDDPAADWTGWDAVVLRSAWDYPERRDAFVAWAHRVARASRLRNSAEVVAYNSDKRYLLDLAAAGVPTVPSAIAAPGDPVHLPAGDVVVKPAVSAGARDTGRFGADAHAQALAHAGSLHTQGRTVLVQPYVAAVDEHGETALVYIADRFSHAIRKGPILRRGGTEMVSGLFAREDIAVRAPSAAEHAVAEAALDALPHDRRTLLYARVDLVQAAAGTPQVLEVELIEPSLFLRHADGAPQRLAAAIVAGLTPAA